MQELDFLKGIVAQAGEITLKHHCDEPEFWEKPDGQGRVSIADLEVDRFLCDAIAKAYPDDAILTEERDDDLARLGNDRVWIVDPIDGTEAYLQGENFFAISVGLAIKGEVVLGVIFAPKHDRLYWAVKGAGAFMNGGRIHATKVDDISKARILASGAKYNRPLLDQEPPIDRHFRPSIAYRLAMVAEGHFDGTFALRPSWEWDLAAGAVIASEAGAVLCDREGVFARFNQDPPQINGMIAGAPDLVQKLVKRII